MPSAAQTKASDPGRLIVVEIDDESTTYSNLALFQFSVLRFWCWDQTCGNLSRSRQLNGRCVPVKATGLDRAVWIKSSSSNGTQRLCIIKDQGSVFAIFSSLYIYIKCSVQCVDIETWLFGSSISILMYTRVKLSMTEIRESSKDNTENRGKTANKYAADEGEDDGSNSHLVISLKGIVILSATLAAATLTLIPKIFCMLDMGYQIPAYLHPEHPLMACLESISTASLGASLLYFSKPLFLTL